MQYVDRIVRFFHFFRENKKYNLMVLFFAPHGRTHQLALPVRRLMLCIALLTLGCIWVCGSTYCVYELAYRNQALSRQLEASREQLFTMQLRYENVIEKAYLPASAPTARASALAHLPKERPVVVSKRRPEPAKPHYFSMVPLVQIALAKETTPADHLSAASAPASVHSAPVSVHSTPAGVNTAPIGANSAPAAPANIELGGVARRNGGLIRIDYFIRKVAQDGQTAQGYVWAYAVFTDTQKAPHYLAVPQRIVFKPGSDEPENFMDAYTFKVNRMKQGKIGIDMTSAEGKTLEHVVIVAVDKTGRPMAREVLSLQ